MGNGLKSVSVILVSRGKTCDHSVSALEGKYFLVVKLYRNVVSYLIIHICKAHSCRIRSSFMGAVTFRFRPVFVLFLPWAVEEEEEEEEYDEEAAPGDEDEEDGEEEEEVEEEEDISGEVRFMMGLITTVSSEQVSVFSLKGVSCILFSTAFLWNP